EATRRDIVTWKAVWRVSLPPRRAASFCSASGRWAWRRICSGSRAPMAVFPLSSPPFADQSPPPPLCLADDATFWPWHPWTDFARWPDKPDVTVVLPVAGFADWGLDAPLDAEETVLLSVLRAASARAPLP